MIVLAIESATDAAGAALADDDGVLATATVESGRRHTETIAPAVSWVCRHAGVGLGEVGAIALDAGPGLFTGLRVGAATAQGLALGLGIKVAMVSSTEVLAAGLAMAGGGGGARVVAVVDARRGEVFWGTFGQSGREGDDRVGPPEVLAGEIATSDEPLVLVGGGANRYAHLFGGLPGVNFAPAVLARPHPGVLALLGVRAAGAGRTVDPREVVPTYLREADTRVNWESRLAPLGAHRTGSPGQ